MHDESGCANYNGEAALQLSAGLVPKLKHVCMWENIRIPSREITRQKPIRPQWQGLHPQSDSEWREMPQTKDAIQGLAIHAFLPLTLKRTGYREEDGQNAPCIRMLPLNDGKDQEAMAITMRQVLINAAVYESLAQSIFQQMPVTHTLVEVGLPPKLDFAFLHGWGEAGYAGVTLEAHQTLQGQAA
ncbi:hypothetical protein COCMIDRAFT_27262 [Bipolaris oryzae ATCC 44560]|uniref:Uncharacterized protein n=1 Tax=Bipolaris oryzae ATCC 44560 TaxID=930090 RepID=W6ZA25_COCMI|nr:uncharacterized protein COCMIDRAFT_27262 [Bipolaris oryzae ATCC 44560]EUC44384.1 hypothetical protein COCMIDRAFT_27262 [Bipolaris oryzae ATCC 44560]